MAPKKATATAPAATTGKAIKTTQTAKVSKAPATKKAAPAKTTSATTTSKPAKATKAAAKKPAAETKKTAAATKKTAAETKKAAAETKKAAAETKKPAAESKKTAAETKTAAATKKAGATKAPAKKATKNATKKAAEPINDEEPDVQPQADNEQPDEVAASSKPKPAKAAPKAKATANGKRKRVASAEAEEEIDEAGSQEPAAKKAKTEADEAAPAPRKVAQKAAPPPRRRIIRKKINEPPTQPLQAFVFGEGTSGELGLGSIKVDGKKPIDVKRPRLNPRLNGVVQIACGGMHAVALTKDNKILTWGVNDNGALGRDTNWTGGVRDIDDDSDSEDEDDTGMNPKESTPGEIDTTNIEPDTTFVQVVACDSATFALTDEGRVYGWGTFRNNEGVLGFTRTGPETERIPILLSGLTKITQLAAGANHVLALDGAKKRVLAWGSGQQCQLARKLVERDPLGSLIPVSVGNLKRGAVPTKLACGSYHSFVIDDQGRVFAWGLNNFGELGVASDAGEDGGTVLKPTLVESLSEYKIASISGGEHHSLACTEDGKLLTWGRIDGHQVGQPKELFTKDNVLYDQSGHPRVLVKPTVVEGIPPVSFVTAGVDTSIIVTRDGQAYSWGFSTNYQTGLGTGDDVELPTRIANSAVIEKKLVWAGAGGQFSMLAAPLEE